MTNSSMTNLPIIARFRFLPERIEDFSIDGKEVVEMQFESVGEVQEYAEHFADAILEAFALVNGKVVPCTVSNDL